ncbi:MAG TPA: beta-propeller fold lactonase family protein, partial [Pyrinomonadaceae bacterium]|nr:beta-propeller fold lactonase family protein [Pyrinomonadaceae bacterium]
MRRKKNDFNRREFLRAVGGAATVFSLAGQALSQASKNEKTKEMLVYIGTYTSGKSRSEGIYVYKFNAGNGALSPYKTVGNVVEPSFLTIDKDRKYLFAVNETTEYEGKKSGAVSAFAIDRRTGNLTFLNKQASLGGAPCFVTVSENGK